MLMRGRRGLQQATNKYIGGYRSRLRVNRIVIAIICVTIVFYMFLLVPYVHHMAPLGGLVDHGPEKYWMNPFLALIMFDLGLALES